MLEILTMGDITKDFKRLGVEVRQTYKGKKYGVCEVTEKEFDKIFSDNDEIEGQWEDGGLHYCEGSNLCKPNDKIIINGEKIIAWYNYDEDFDSEEEKQAYLKENNGIMELRRYPSLLEYLCDRMGCSLLKNICALTKDLAKFNDMKLSELFKKYQG